MEPGDRHADDPVADEVGDGGGARVAESAEGAGGDHLQAVEDFEEGGDAQERGAGADDGDFGGVEARDPAGDDGEREAGGGHECSAEQQSGPTGDGDARRVFPADGLAEAGGHDGNGTKDGAFHEDLQGGGKAEGEEAADDWEVGTEGKRSVVGDSGIAPDPRWVPRSRL